MGEVAGDMVVHIGTNPFEKVMTTAEAEWLETEWPFWDTERPVIVNEATMVSEEDDVSNSSVTELVWRRLKQLSCYLHTGIWWRSHMPLRQGRFLCLLPQRYDQVRWNTDWIEYTYDRELIDWVINMTDAIVHRHHMIARMMLTYILRYHWNR